MSQHKAPYKILIAGGGTGGHIFPAVAIANALRKRMPTIQIQFVGAKGKMEMEKVPQAGFAITGLDIAGFNRSSLLKNISLPWKLLKSFFQVKNILRDFQPDAVIGVGGYSSFPVLRGAQIKGIPTFIHEANSFAGKSNQLLAKRAVNIFVAHDQMQNFFPSGKLIVSGNPVRESIVSANISKDQAVSVFGLDASKPVVFVTGGSLGAKGINDAVALAIPALESHGVQLIWQTGKQYAEKAKVLTENKIGMWTGEFVSNMETAYAAADIVVSRSGAMAIAELCIVKKPTIFVPFPFAAEDHQTVNAKILVEREAAMLVKDVEATTQLLPAILDLIQNTSKQEIFKKNMGMLAIVDADQRVAQSILHYLDNQ